MQRLPSSLIVWLSSGPLLKLINLITIIIASSIQKGGEKLWVFLFKLDRQLISLLLSILTIPKPSSDG